MASRVEHRHGARRARLSPPEPAAGPAGTARRAPLAAGVVVAAVIVAGAAILVAAGGPARGGLQHGAAARATVAAVRAALTGIPQHGETLGAADAPVTIEYFGDLECPACRALTLGRDGGGLPQLIAGPVRRGQVKLRYRAVESASRAVNADRFVAQQVAAEAAGDQDLAWDYVELFYREQGAEDSRYVTEAFLRGLAAQTPGLTVGRWLADRRRLALAAELRADARAAAADGLRATPTLIAIGPRHREVVPASGGIPSFSQITTAIQAVR